MKEIILSVETTCDIPVSVLDKMGVKYIPLSFYNEKDGKENPQLTLKAFYDEIRNGATFKTSLINEYTFKQYFEELLKKGDVLHLGFDSSISGTFSCAQNAAKNAQEVVKYLFDNNVIVNELKTDKIGLEEYYINLMANKEVK